MKNVPNMPGEVDTRELTNFEYLNYSKAVSASFRSLTAPTIS